MASDEQYIDYVADKHDSWMPIQDNMNMFGVGFGLYYMFVHYRTWEWVTLIVVAMIQFMWEAKNALIPYMNAEYFGGWGYSWKAEIYGFGGLFLAFLIDVAWPPAIQKKMYAEIDGDEDMDF